MTWRFRSAIMARPPVEVAVAGSRSARARRRPGGVRDVQLQEDPDRGRIHRVERNRTGCSAGRWRHVTRRGCHPVRMHARRADARLRSESLRDHIDRAVGLHGVVTDASGKSTTWTGSTDEMAAPFPMPIGDGYHIEVQQGAATLTTNTPGPSAPTPAWNGGRPSSWVTWCLAKMRRARML